MQARSGASGKLPVNQEMYGPADDVAMGRGSRIDAPHRPPPPPGALAAYPCDLFVFRGRTTHSKAAVPVRGRFGLALIGARRPLRWARDDYNRNGEALCFPGGPCGWSFSFWYGANSGFFARFFSFEPGGTGKLTFSSAFRRPRSWTIAFMIVGLVGLGLPGTGPVAHERRGQD